MCEVIINSFCLLSWKINKSRLVKQVMGFNRRYVLHKLQKNVNKINRSEDLVDENRHFGKAHEFGEKLAWSTDMTTYFKRGVKKMQKAKIKIQKNCKIFLAGQKLKIRPNKTLQNLLKQVTK